MWGVVALAAAPLLLRDDDQVENSIVQLSSTEYLSTKQDRQFLDYLIRCALPHDVVVESNSRYGHFRLRGRHGLAPDWTVRRLTEQEEESVSACILALTNKFGIPVPVYLVPGMKPPIYSIGKRQGAEAYSLFEGAFFGNLFRPDAKAFVCIGDGRTISSGDKVWFKRVCSEPEIPGSSKSRCGMVIVGRCSEDQFFTMSGKTWNNPIQVYLRPDGSSQTKLEASDNEDNPS